jgi:hypothetical protein
MDSLCALSERITQAIAAGLEASDVIILTLGLTEAWQHNQTGFYACQPPGAGLGSATDAMTFRPSTFLENYNNVRRILDLTWERYSSKQFIISVSPVRLDSTFTKTDVGTANLESKSILRAVAGQIARENPERVYYLPSYEAAMLGVGRSQERDRFSPRTDGMCARNLWTQS